MLAGKPAKSLHRMLSLNGNPSMDNLAAIIDALRSTRVEIEVHPVGTA
jgi:DNA-binding phage protein